VNLFKSPLRRTTAVLAGAFIGMAGAVALAAPASAHAPTVTGSTTCVQDGKWTIDWSVGNDFKKNANVTKITLNPEGATVTGPVSEKQADGKGALIPQSSAGNKADQVHGSTTVSDSKHYVKISVWLKWTDGYETEANKPATYLVKQPDACAPDTTPTPTPTATPPGEPTPVLSQDCTTITLGLKNPAEGKEFTLKFKTSKGEERSDVVKPGETKTEMFSATPGFTVTLSIAGAEGSKTVAYQKPSDCSTAGEGGGGVLAKTGAAGGPIAAGAGVLLVLGGVLFFMARRRKVKFTA
jgi:LPXTG-motif cell wall-anchored protein